MNKSEQELTKLIEQQFDSVSKQIVEVKEGLKQLHESNAHLINEINPIYQRVLVLTGKISELKLAFRIG